MSYSQIAREYSHQSTGLCACCSKYGDLEDAKRLLWDGGGGCAFVSPPVAMPRNR